MSPPAVSALITDLDNTLFDWLDSWYHSFRLLLAGIVEVSGLPVEVLLPEIKALHQQHGTSEYAYLIHQLPALRARHAECDLPHVYQGVIAACRAARQARLALYPGVMETLLTLKHRGVVLVAHTESLARYSVDRLLLLGLDGVIDVLYAPADHASPDEPTEGWALVTPSRGLTRTAQRATPRGRSKPNPALLLAILAELGIDRSRAVYVGDSLSRDVAMAQAAGVADVYAHYGAFPYLSASYELLRAVSHWSGSEARREALSALETIQPTRTLTREFSEILGLFDFVAHPSGGRALPGHS
jgi:phosphoglycolate phosphatase-like HAD superfamily hydrolase